MKTNITVEVDDQLARELRALAARRGISLSQLVAEQLEVLVWQDETYGRARRRSLQRLAKGYDLQWDKAPSRDEFHDR